MSAPREGAARSIPPWVPVREELRGEEPYGAPQLDVPVQLNTNENPYGPSPEIARDIADEVLRAATSLNRYPDREAADLRAALAAYLGHGMTVDTVWAANGSNEVMQQILQAFGGPGRSALSFAPTYSMYPEYARNTHTRWVEGMRRDDFSIDIEAARRLITREKPDVVFLASPNNPSGTAIEPSALRAIVEVAPGVVVVDEAYAEFRRSGTPTALELLPEFPKLLVTRTMSKAFAFAGGRLGYVAADPAIIDVLRVVRLPYHLSAVSQAAALAALRHADELLAQVDALRATRDDVATWLAGEGFDVAASDANFILFGTFEDRHATWQALLDRGVLIREVGPVGWLRVSMGTPDEMEAFKQALKEVTA